MTSPTVGLVMLFWMWVSRAVWAWVWALVSMVGFRFCTQPSVLFTVPLAAKDWASALGEACDLNHVETLQEFILLVARVETHPAVSSLVDGAAGGEEVDSRFHPHVFHLHFGDAAAADDAGNGRAAGTGVVHCGIDAVEAAGPVAKLIFGNFDGAVHIARRDTGGAQQCNGETGNVHAAAAL